MCSGFFALLRRQKIFLNHVLSITAEKSIAVSFVDGCLENSTPQKKQSSLFLETIVAPK